MDCCGPHIIIFKFPKISKRMKKKGSFFSSKYTVCYLLFPSLLMITLVLVYPLFYSFYLSFMEWNIAYARIQFKGIGNYIELIFDSALRQALFNNILYAAICLTVELLIGFGLALLLAEKFVGRSIIRILLLLPFLTAPTLAGLEFRWIFNEQFGLLNQVLVALHLSSKQNWLSDPILAKVSIMVVDIWQNTPFMMLLLLAGLESLPIGPYEAATVDGASEWQKFKYLTLPLLKPVIGIACILRIIDLFRVFDTVFVITEGGPAGATELLSTYVYRVGFQYGKFGYAAAGSWCTLLISFLIILPFLNRIRKIET